MRSDDGLLIFDLDGTLVDSRPDIAAAANTALAGFGIRPFSEEAVGRGIGRGTAALFKELLGPGTESALIGALVTAFRKRYEANLCERTTLYPGVAELLRGLRGRTAVIVTNKSQPFADVVVDRLGIRKSFRGVFGAEAFKGTKPSPRPLLEVCARWKVAPAAAVMIGDTVVDIQAGKRAGLTTVAALYGYGDPDELKGLGPDFEARAASELLGLLTGGSA